MGTTYLEPHVKEELQKKFNGMGKNGNDDQESPESGISKYSMRHQLIKLSVNQLIMID